MSYLEPDVWIPVIRLAGIGELEDERDKNFNLIIEKEPYLCISSDNIRAHTYTYAMLKKQLLQFDYLTNKTLLKLSNNISSEEYRSVEEEIMREIKRIYFITSIDVNRVHVRSEHQEYRGICYTQNEILDFKKFEHFSTGQRNFSSQLYSNPNTFVEQAEIKIELKK